MPDLKALKNEARTLLAKVLVTPPTVKCRKVDSISDLDVVGDTYLSIDGHTFEVYPVRGQRQAIGRKVAVVEWVILVTSSVATDNDPLASPDVEEIGPFDSFHEALSWVAGLWVTDQLFGHTQENI